MAVPGQMERAAGRMIWPLHDLVCWALRWSMADAMIAPTTVRTVRAVAINPGA